jgi:hypothetical protein
MSGKLNEEKEGVSYDSFKEKLQNLDKHELNILKKHFLKGNSQKVAEYLRKKYFKNFEWDEIVSCVEIFFENESLKNRIKEQQAFKSKKRGYKGSYFVDSNSDSGKFEVRHTDRLPGHVFSSWDTQKEADADAKKRNEKIGIKENKKFIKEYGGSCDFEPFADGGQRTFSMETDDTELVRWVEKKNGHGYKVFSISSQHAGYARYLLFATSEEIDQDLIGTCMWDEVNDDWFSRMRIDPTDLVDDELEENKKMVKEQKEPYSGVGKFNSALDELLYSAVLEGWTSEETGDVSEQGVHYDFIPLDGMESVKNLHINFKEQFEQLTEEEVAELENARAAIIEENDQGFIAIELFNSKEEADEKWAEIEYGLTGEDDQTAGVEEDNEDDLMGEQKTCPCKKCDDEDEEDEDLKEAKKQIVKERFSDISGVDDISIEDELDPKGVDDYLPEDELDDEFLKGSDTDPLDDDGEEEF